MASRGTNISGGSTKLSKKIGWMNGNCQLSQPIMYKDVSHLLESMGEESAFTLLKQLEEKGPQVRDPTGYLKVAAQRALTGAPPPHAAHGYVQQAPPQAAYMQQSPYMQQAQYMPPGPCMSGGDPGLPDKVKRRVGWLNANAGLLALLNFDQIVGPLSTLGDKQAMDILKRLEESAAEVRDPNGYVVAAAKRAPQGAPQQVAAYPPQMTYPAAYPGVPAAFQPQAQAYAQGMAIDPRATGVKGVIKTGLKVKHGMDTSELAGKVKKRIGWLNSNAGLTQPLLFDKVGSLLTALEHSQAMQILKDLETRAETVNDPTAYVAVAAKKAAAAAPAASGGYDASGYGAMAGYDASGYGMAGMGMQMGGMPVMQSMPGMGPMAVPQADERLKKKIGWMNNNLKLASPLMYNKVSPFLVQIDGNEAMKILKKLEENAETVRDPTGWVIGGAQKAGAVREGAPQGFAPFPTQMAVPQGYMQPPPVQTYMQPSGAQTDERLRKRIGWLNSKAGLLGDLRYDQAAPLLSSLDPNQAMEILKHLEENAASVNDPTGWVTAAAKRALTQQAAGGAGPTVYPAMGGQQYQQQVYAMQVLAGNGPATQQTNAMQALADEKLRKRIGWLNHNAGLQSELSYQKTGPQLLRLTVTEAMSILKQLEENAANVPEPNSWVVQQAMSSPSYGSNGPPSTVAPPPGHGPRGSGSAPPEERLRKRIGWLNSKVPLSSPLDAEMLLPSLLALDIVRAMAVLKNLEDAAATTPDPNAYVEAAAQQAMAEGGGGQDYSGQASWTQPPGSSTGANSGFYPQAGTQGLEEALRQRIDWINANVPMAEPIIPDQVAPVLACLDVGQALEVLRSVEDNAASLQSPNAHIVAAAQGFA